MKFTEIARDITIVSLFFVLSFVAFSLITWAGKQSSDSLFTQLLQHEDKYTAEQIKGFVNMVRHRDAEDISLALCKGEEVYILPDFSVAVVVTVLYNHSKEKEK